MGGKQLGGGMGGLNRVFLVNENEDDNDNSKKERAYQKDTHNQEHEIRKQTQTKAAELLTTFKDKIPLLAKGCYHIEMDGTIPVLCYKSLAGNRPAIRLPQIDIEEVHPIVGDKKDNPIYRTDGAHIMYENQVSTIEGEVKYLGKGYLVNGNKILYYGKSITYHDSFYYGTKETFNTENLQFLSQMPAFQNLSTEEYPELSAFLSDGLRIIKGNQVSGGGNNEPITFDDQGYICQGSIKIILAKKGGPQITKGKSDNSTPYYDPHTYQSTRRRGFRGGYRGR